MPSDYLAHYGVVGMKWGIRRYQPYPKGDRSKGRYLGESHKENAPVRAIKAVGRAPVRAAKSVGRGVTKAVRDYNSLERRAARNVKNDVMRDKKKVNKMSQEELNATLRRMETIDRAKNLNETINHPKARRIQAIGDKIVNRVIDKSIDEALKRTIGAPSELERKAKTAKTQADYMKSRVKIAEAKRDLEKLRNGEDISTKKKKKKDED